MRPFTLLFAASAATALSGPALAGGFAPAATEPDRIVVVEPTAPRSTWGVVLPLLVLGAVVGAATGGSEGSANGTRPRN